MDKKVKVKASHTRYWAYVGPGADPGVQTVSPQVTISHPPSGTLPLLSSRPAVTSPAAEHHRPLAGTKLYCLVTEAHRREQFSQGCYAALSRVEFELAIYWSPVIARLHWSATWWWVISLPENFWSSDKWYQKILPRLQLHFTYAYCTRTLFFPRCTVRVLYSWRWRTVAPWYPSNTMWPGPRPTSVPSGILIHPTVWPQYTKVTDRQTRQATVW